MWTSALPSHLSLWPSIHIRAEQRIGHGFLFSSNKCITKDYFLSPGHSILINLSYSEQIDRLVWETAVWYHVLLQLGYTLEGGQKNVPHFINDKKETEWWGEWEQQVGRGSGPSLSSPPSFPASSIFSCAPHGEGDRCEPHCRFLFFTLTFLYSCSLVWNKSAAVVLMHTDNEILTAACVPMTGLMSPQWKIPGEKVSGLIIWNPISQNSTPPAAFDVPHYSFSPVSGSLMPSS